MDTNYYVEKFVDIVTEEIGNNLIGVYLHGSLAMGCFHEETSDIDLLIIVQEKLSLETNKRVIQQVLELHDKMPNKRGMEFSILLQSTLTNFVYPTPFELHYSDFHREKYRTDETYICGGFNDVDLAAHVMVTYHRGVTLYGKAIKNVFLPINRELYIQSILFDVENAYKEIIQSPTYFTLNLCRVLFFLREGVVSSKKEGGEWGLNMLLSKYYPLIQHCLHAYKGTITNNELHQQELMDFAAYMLCEIKNHLPRSFVQT
ncbi:aminoglycoside adenylyltransferase domain-containing protein [Priestia taiwanensis]|uniref:Spectinomycin 9-adenylyltransferase n=1 Tax=Priestia taiwanensis TaxID=1347902 RepID=A0A917EPC9_9BACI|nr:aminoglycoside adenylyltransferase domain-containing protein [Priestia taiwanensis]MBM7363142.1 streptomycin 3'-adenylyltransferase [Priestia taiwanensis]GGE68036.1 adenylyltransferase [Priestia taiwanensis]